jgi:hypothetical protein
MEGAWAMNYPPLNEREADQRFYEHKPKLVSPTEEKIKTIAADIGWANLSALVKRLKREAQQ